VLLQPHSSIRIVLVPLPPPNAALHCAVNEVSGPSQLRRQLGLAVVHRNDSAVFLRSWRRHVLPSQCIQFDCCFRGLLEDLGGDAARAMGNARIWKQGLNGSAQRIASPHSHCMQDLSAASNIFFTNGELDPWRAGGVILNVTATAPPSITSLVIANGDHHCFAACQFHMLTNATLMCRRASP
jgi:hypothetical protein